MHLSSDILTDAVVAMPGAPPVFGLDRREARLLTAS